MAYLPYINFLIFKERRSITPLRGAKYKDHIDIKVMGGLLILVTEHFYSKICGISKLLPHLGLVQILSRLGQSSLNPH